MASKLFGNSNRSKFGGDRPAPQPSESGRPTGKQTKRKRTRSRLRPLKVILSILLVLEILYCIAIFSNISIIKELREIYIKTAMSTMNHQWLATAFIPSDIINELVEQGEQAKQEQIGLNSSWDDVDATTEPTDEATEPSTEDSTEPEETTEPPIPQAQLDFFARFDEIDEESMLAYVEEHPDVVANGWDKLYINEAGLDDEGTSIRTTTDDQVLAIDAENEILLIRVTGSGILGDYRGVLAIAKDPSRLSLGVSKDIGSRGQRAGEIAENYGAHIAITASGFDDPNGGGNGGRVAGGCMSDGEVYGNRFRGSYKRIELHEDNRLYVLDSYMGYSDDCTDASEFWPALVVDGKNALSKNHFFTEMNPRACLGQTRDEEILFLVIEGRFIDCVGTDADECVDILLRYDCYQGMNMDGGTSAIMWYDGEYVTRCSNERLPEGRLMPNAWIYK